MYVKTNPTVQSIDGISRRNIRTRSHSDKSPTILGLVEKFFKVFTIPELRHLREKEFILNQSHGK